MNDTTEFKMYLGKESQLLADLIAKYGNDDDETVKLLSKIPNVTCLRLNIVNRHHETELEHICVITGPSGEVNLRNLFVRLNTKCFWTELHMAGSAENNTCIFSIVHKTKLPKATRSVFAIELQEYLKGF